MGEYFSLRQKMPHLAELEQKTRDQAVQLTELAKRINDMGARMAKLQVLENNVRLLVDMEPSNDENAPFSGVGGSDPDALNPEYVRKQNRRKLVGAMHQALDELETEATIQALGMEELCAFLKEHKSILDCTPSIWPTKGWISSRFGYRTSPFTNQKEFHKGLDICTNMGTEIVAPADGIISRVAKDRGYGTILTINHKYGVKTRYAHLNKVLVKKGQSVKRGDKIALVGKSGRTTGPHLHYEVHLNGLPVDPLRYILN